MVPLYKSFYMTAKTPAQSETIKTEVVCPNDANPMGILQGGRLVEWMDIAAAVCAQTHAGYICVTASINKVDFRRPARIGDIIIIKAKLNRVFSTSLDIGVQAFVHNIKEYSMELISNATFMFVALGDKGIPVTVPGMNPETEVEKKNFELAGERRKI